MKKHNVYALLFTLSIASLQAAQSTVDISDSDEPVDTNEQKSKKNRKRNRGIKQQSTNTSQTNNVQSSQSLVDIDNQDPTVDIDNQDPTVDINVNNSARGSFPTSREDFNNIGNDAINMFKDNKLDMFIFKLNGIFGHIYNLEYNNSKAMFGRIIYNYKNTGFVSRHAKNIFLSIPFSLCDYFINIPSNIVLSIDDENNNRFVKSIQINCFKDLNYSIWTNTFYDIGSNLSKASFLAQSLAGIGITAYKTVWSGVGFWKTLMFIGLGFGAGIVSGLTGHMLFSFAKGELNQWVSLAIGSTVSFFLAKYMFKYLIRWINTSKADYIRGLYNKDISINAYEASSQTWMDWAKSFFTSRKNTDVSKPGMIMSYLYYAYEHYIITTAIVLTIVFGGGYLYTENFAKK